MSGQLKTGLMFTDISEKYMARFVEFYKLYAAVSRKF